MQNLEKENQYQNSEIQKWERTNLGLYTYLYRKNIDIVPKLKLKLLPLEKKVSNEILELINCDRLKGLDTTLV
jgi:hypothetical protein